MFEPNSTYSYCILSHAHCLSRSLSPTRLTLSIARRAYVIGWPCFLPRTKYIYTSVTGSSLKLHLIALTLPKSSIGQYLSRAYIYLFNECRTTLTLSLYLSVSRLTLFLTSYIPRIEATSPSLVETELFTLRGGLQPWINL